MEIIIHLVLRDRFDYPLQWVKTVRADENLSSEERKKASKVLQSRAKEIKRERETLLGLWQGHHFSISLYAANIGF